jgi:hypothetical protein
MLAAAGKVFPQVGVALSVEVYANCIDESACLAISIVEAAVQSE